MDPNATLRQLRATLEAMNSPECHAEQRELLAADAAEQFEALDGWLTKGGFLPDAWAAHR